jgi:hypothetical protein
MPNQSDLRSDFLGCSGRSFCFHSRWNDRFFHSLLRFKLHPDILVAKNSPIQTSFRYFGSQEYFQLLCQQSAHSRFCRSGTVLRRAGGMELPAASVGTHPRGKMARLWSTLARVRTCGSLVSPWACLVEAVVIACQSLTHYGWSTWEGHGELHWVLGLGGWDLWVWSARYKSHWIHQSVSDSTPTIYVPWNLAYSVNKFPTRASIHDASIYSRASHQNNAPMSMNARKGAAGLISASRQVGM